MHAESYIELSRDEVACRARQLPRAAGRPGGRDLEYWLQAEVELLTVRSANLRKIRGYSGDAPHSAEWAAIPKPLEFVVAKSGRWPNSW